MHLLISCAFFLLVLLNPLKSGAQAPSSTIPTFTFYKLDGSPFTKKDLSASTKTIFMFIDVEGKHCQKGVEELEKNLNEFKLTSIYLVTLNKPEEMQKFIDKHGRKIKDRKNFVFLQDKDKQFINKFAPTKYPAFYVYSSQGNLIQYFAGPTKIKELVKAIK